MFHCEQVREQEVDVGDQRPLPQDGAVAEGSESRTAAAAAWGKKLTFRKAVHTIVTGQRIHNEITVRGAVVVIDVRIDPSRDFLQSK